jgi:hypothetical protein
LPGVVVPTCNLSLWEAEAGVQGWLELHIKIMSKKKGQTFIFPYKSVIDSQDWSLKAFWPCISNS